MEQWELGMGWEWIIGLASAWWRVTYFSVVYNFWIYDVNSIWYKTRMVSNGGRAVYRHSQFQLVVVLCRLIVLPCAREVVQLLELIFMDFLFWHHIYIFLALCHCDTFLALCLGRLLTTPRSDKILSPLN